MALYKVETLADLWKQIHWCHDRNIPFVAESNDNGFSIQVETGRELLACNLPDEQAAIDAAKET